MVVFAGETCSVPFRFTGPTSGSMRTDAAFWELQVSWLFPPAEIVTGAAVRLTPSWLLAAIVTVALAVEVPPIPFAVAV